MTAEIKIPWTTEEVAATLNRMTDVEQGIVKGFIAGRQSVNHPAPAPTPTRQEA